MEIEAELEALVECRVVTATRRSRGAAITDKPVAKSPANGDEGYV
jgi:hypothetical protein